MKKKQAKRILITVISLLLLNIYFGIHLQEFLRDFATLKWVVVFWIIFELLALPLIISAIPMPSVTIAIRRALKVVAHSLLAYCILLLYGFIIYDVIFIIVNLLGKEVPGEFVAVYGIFLLVATSFFYMLGLRNAWIPTVSKYSIEIDKKIKGKKQLKVVMMSDLHLGNMVGNRQLARMVDKVNKLDADLILFVGDVLDDSVEPFIRNNMGAAFEKLDAKMGKYAVLGNHEYYGKHVDKYCDEMAKTSVPVLQDGVIEVANGIVVAGRKDKLVETITPEGRLTTRDLLKDVDRGKAIILLDHQPSDLDVAAEVGVDLALYGHTHRGQMAPYHILTKRKFEVDWGYIKKDATHIIVSSGFGVWGPPIRLKSKSEIVEINITFA